MDNSRIASHQTAAQVGAAQLKEWASLLPKETILVADRYYGSANFVRLTQELGWTKVLRVKANQVFYQAVPPPPAHTKPKRGAPRKDGPVFRLKDPTSYGPADEQWHGLDEQGRPLLLARWDSLHSRRVRECEVSLVRVERPRASDKKRDPKVSWFMLLEAGGAEWRLELAEIVGLYRRRYGIEHGYRFDKQSLLWERPRLRTPEQFELWTLLMGAVHNQLVLARPIVAEERRAWESKLRPATLSQVRRGLSSIIAHLERPSRPPHLRGKSPGRAVGAKIKPAARYEVVRKAKKPVKKRRRAALSRPLGCKSADEVTF